MSRVVVSLAFVAFTVLAFVFWQQLGTPRGMPEVPGGRFECMSYTPYAPGGSPLDKDYAVDPVIIHADLEALKPYTNCLRTYSSIGPQGDVVRIAAELGMQVMQGMWVRGDVEDDTPEIEGALTLARDYPQTVRALIVGNEVLLRREMSGRRLADMILAVKARTTVPVTYADIFEFWRRNPEVAEAVDYVTLHILPHWDDPAPVSIDQVQDHVATIIATARATFPGKPMAIGEIGWPSAGRTRGGAVPSRVNEARFLREFANNADALGLPYNIIEAKDQPWKRGPEGTVGGYWGILDEMRIAKFPLIGPVAEWPRWREAFAVATAFSGLLFGAGLLLARGRKLAWNRSVVLAAFSVVSGTLLMLALDFMVVTSLGIQAWLFSGVGIVVASALALLTLPMLVKTGGRWAKVAPASLGDLMVWARSWFHGGLTAERLLGLLFAAVLLSTTIINLWLTFDPRHRDLPVMIYLWLALVLLARGRKCAPRGTEEGWLAVVLIGCAPFTTDGIVNAEAMAWAAVSLLLALPWLSAIKGEASRLMGGLHAQPRQTH